MLVITRKPDESIIIAIQNVDGFDSLETGEKSNEKTIEITVLETTKDKVKLGVKAPRNIKIIRSELIIAQSANVEASQAVSQNALDALLKNTRK